MLRPCIGIKVIFIGDDFEGMNLLYRGIIGKERKKLGKACVKIEETTIEYEDKTFGKICFQLSLWIPEEKWTINETRRLYFAGAKIGILVYNPGREETIMGVEKWIEKFVKNIRTTSVIMIVKNKVNVEGIVEDEILDKIEEWKKKYNVAIAYQEYDGTKESAKRIVQQMIELLLEEAKKSIKHRMHKRNSAT